MERTNFVSKAKRLIMQNARTTALVIVPLAAAVSAQANPVQLPTGNLSCSATPSGGSCNIYDVQLGDGTVALQGISFFTSGGSPITFSVSPSGSNVQAELGAGGTINGPIAAGTEIPISWVLDLSADGLSITSYNIGFELGTSLGDTTYSGVSGGGATSGGQVSGSEILTVEGGGISGGTVWETVTISVNFSNTGSGGEILIDVPEGASADFDSVPGATTPEPATLGLMGSGLAMLGLLFRRRKR